MAVIGSASNITTSAVTITAISEGPQMRVWQYRLSTTSGGGGWTNISAGLAFNASIRVTGLAENTLYYYAVRAIDNSTGTLVTSPQYTFSTTKSMTAPTVTASVDNITTSEFRIVGTANFACRNWEYSLNGGTWTSLSGSTSATTVSKVITGLSPATAYSVRVRATRVYNSVTGTSTAVTATTLGGATLNYVHPMNADAATVNLIINWTTQSGYTHTIRIKEGATTIVTLTGLTGASGAKKIALSGAQRTALLAHMANKASFMATFELQTLSGGSQVGAISSLSELISTNYAYSAPILPGFTHSEQNTKVSAVDSVYVKTLSDIRVVCDVATPLNGASIVKYGVTILGKSVESPTRTIDYGSPNGCGTDLIWTAWVEDSRGYITSHTEKISIYCYEKPEVLTWEALRNQDNDWVDLKVQGTVRTSPSNALANAQIRIRQSDNPTWGSWENLTGLTNVGIITPGRRGYEYSNANWKQLDPNITYLAQVRFQDLYEEWSTSIVFEITKLASLISLREDRVGINNPDPRAALDIFDEELGGFFINDNFLSGGIHSYGDNANGKWITFTTGITIQVFYKLCTQADFTTLNSASGLTGAAFRSQLQNFNFPIEVDRTFHMDFSIGGGSVVALRSRPVIAKFGYGSTTELSTTMWHGLSFWHWDTFGATFDVHIGLFTIGWRDIS